MLKTVQAVPRFLLEPLRRGLQWAFGANDNPLHWLGALTIFFFWVVLVSGIYVFVFFETSIFGAYQTVDYLTHEQWYLGGVMRSLHRYASDAAIITLALHMLSEFASGRYRGARWFSWFTGIPLLWMVFPLGITGYWLVWDQFAQYIALATSELFDALPIFTDPMARNFLTPDSLSDRFFTLLAFLHLLGIPIALVFGIWFHVMRLSHPRVNPPLRLAIGSLAMLLVLSLLRPAVSHAPADLSVAPHDLAFDWFYMLPYPLLDYGSPLLFWGVLVGSSLLLSLLPWMPPLRRAPAAVVDPGNCNGCGRCVADCPFGAVIMHPRDDGSRYKEIAVVDPALCTACGICAGACPSSTPFRSIEQLVSGIDMPTLPIRDMRSASRAALDTVQAPIKVLVYGCDHAIDVHAWAGAEVATVSLPCTGNLPPSFIEFALRREGADGVFLTGCNTGDCFFRQGGAWTEARIAGQREPHLRGNVDAQRVHIAWGAAGDAARVRRELGTFIEQLRGLENPSQGQTAHG
ncbi:MAG: hydrogenase iron-sulfur subunit [Thiohalobacteraceae bacterium]|nr:hydrogenase iron-sulfur subunit [Gammaproteobacteria bacterium]